MGAALASLAARKKEGKGRARVALRASTSLFLTLSFTVLQLTETAYTPPATRAQACPVQS